MDRFFIYYRRRKRFESQGERGETQCHLSGLWGGGSRSPRATRRGGSPGATRRGGSPGAIFATENRWLIILILALAVVAVLIFALRRGFVDWMQGLPGGEKAGFVGRTYYNRVYGFSVSVPNEAWQVAYYGEADTLGQARPGLPLIANMRPLVEMRRRKQDSVVAFVQVGVLGLDQPRTAESLARQDLEETRREASPDSTNFKVLKDVTSTSGGKVQGAYFVVRMPPEEELPMKVVMFFVKNTLGYVLVSQVAKEHYDSLRGDIQSIMNSFRLTG